MGKAVPPVREELFAELEMESAVVKDTVMHPGGSFTPAVAGGCTEAVQRASLLVAAAASCADEAVQRASPPLAAAAVQSREDAQRASPPSAATAARAQEADDFGVS